MTRSFAPGADLDRLETWAKYRNGLCDHCRASCCTMPAEVRIKDLIRMGVVDAFDADESPKTIAKRLIKQGLVEHFHFKREVFTLARLASGDCLFLDRNTRRCSIYDRRPDTCRNHPLIGPRPGYCAFRPRS